MRTRRPLAACVAVALSIGCADVIAVPGDGGLDLGADRSLPPVVDAAPDPEPPQPVDMALDGAPDAAGDPGPCVVPMDEVCNQRDDDCDGAADEGAVCCRENPELCNGADDDCDGVVDEDDACCAENDEICNGADDDCDGAADEGLSCCDGDAEACDGQDNDCDGEVDEGDVCCDAAPEICDDADNDCDGEIDEGGACCGAELCNGADDDCDGTADEGRVCGLYVQSTCQLYMAWADERLGPVGVSRNWDRCPDVGRINQENIGCTSTQFNGAFARLLLNGDVDDNDQFGWAFLCQPGDDPALSTWLQGHCALFIGYADNNRAPPDGAETFAGCPDALQTPAGNLRCTSTGFDGNFRALTTQGDVDDNDDFSFAWICRDDPARPGLAAAVEAQVEVFVGWADEDRGPLDGSQNWSTCPGARSQQNGDVRCIGTAGDGRFHKLNLIGDVNSDDQAGIALRALQ